MDDKTLALLIGGAAPAVLFGLTGFLQKFAGQGIAAGPYLIVVGATATLVGVAITFLEGDKSFTRVGLVSALAIGALWALGVACTAVAIRHYGGNVSQLVPLYNMNTLVAVILGLVLLSEWQTVHPGRILLAAALIVLGGVLASRA
ncbi:MAG TPA: hypothetical protein VGE52_19060 [Pirellulales bacterium]